jgi:ribosomal RNA-processing protein 7
MAKAAAATARGSKRRAASDADATPSSGKKAKKNAKKSKSSAKKRSDGDAHGWRPLPVRLDFGSAFTRHLFVRVPSANAAEGAAEGTALFVAAIPLGWTRAHLRELFEENFGAVEETSLVTLDAAPDVAGGLVRFASASGTRSTRPRRWRRRRSAWRSGSDIIDTRGRGARCVLYTGPHTTAFAW